MSAVRQMGKDFKTCTFANVCQFGGKADEIKCKYTANIEFIWLQLNVVSHLSYLCSSFSINSIKYIVDSTAIYDSNTAVPAQQAIIRSLDVNCWETVLACAELGWTAI